MDTQEGVLP